MRDDQPQRVAVLGRERLAVRVRGQQGALVLDELDRDVGAEVVLGPGDREARARERAAELGELAPVHAFEAGVEAAPARHAVDVLGVAAPRQLVELLPAELELLLDLAADAQPPAREIDLGDASGVQHRPFLGHVLAGRKPRRVEAGVANLLLLARPEHRDLD